MRPQDGAALLSLLAEAPAPAALADSVTSVMPAVVPRRSRFGTGLAVALLALLALAGGVLAYAVTRPADAPAPAATLATTHTVHHRTRSTTLPTTTIPATTHHRTTTHRTTTRRTTTTVFAATFDTTTALPRRRHRRTRRCRRIPRRR